MRCSQVAADLAALPRAEVSEWGPGRHYGWGEESDTRRARNASSDRRAAGRGYQHRSGDLSERVARRYALRPAITGSVTGSFTSSAPGGALDDNNGVYGDLPVQLCIKILR